MAANNQSAGKVQTAPGLRAGRPYATDDYGDTDYSVLLKDAMQAGAGWETVQSLLDQRVEKAKDKGYTQYLYDDVYQTANDYIKDQQYGLYQEYLEELDRQYDALSARQAAESQAAVDQAVGELEGQKAEVEQSYADLYRQLYLDRRRAEKELPQQLAAMGITGGLSESAALGLQTGYSQALSQGEQARLSTLSQMDQAIADARSTGRAAAAQQAGQLAQSRLEQMGEVLTRLQDQRNQYSQLALQSRQTAQQADQQAAQLARQQLLDLLERQDVSYDRKLEAAQYLYENAGDASGFRQLGYTEEQIAALQLAYRQALERLQGK